MQLPKEKKLPTCTHEPVKWDECARCVEDYYLAQLTAERSRCVQARGQIASAATAVRAASALLQDGPVDGSTRRRILDAYNAEDCASTVFASLKLGKERSSEAPFGRLRELVEVEESSAMPGVWFGRGRVFSVLRERPDFTGNSADEVAERVLLAVLDELEAQKAALEVRAALVVENFDSALSRVEELKATLAEVQAGKDRAEKELRKTKEALLAAELEAEHLDVSFRQAHRDRQAERAGRREILKTFGCMKEVGALPDFPEPAGRRPYVEREEVGSSMLTAFRNAVAKAGRLENRVEQLEAEKDRACAERNELAALAENERDAMKARAILAETSRRDGKEAFVGAREAPDMHPRAHARADRALAGLRAQLFEEHARALETQKDEAHAERNELAALVVQMARALGLPAGWRVDKDAGEGWQTLLVVQLPGGQVSWHLPDSERGIGKHFPRVDVPWDGHSKAEARRRIREAILDGPRALLAFVKAQHPVLVDEPPSPAEREGSPRPWRAALAATAPKHVDGRPCWCQVDWRGLRVSNHGDACERLTALLQEMEEKGV